MTKSFEAIKQKYYEQLNQHIIAVDFDGTITANTHKADNPKLNKTAKKYLDRLHDLGYRLVLWTARLEDNYLDAYNMCINEFEMPYIEMDSESFIHGISGKLVCSYYIDDRSIPGGKINWKETFNYIVETFPVDKEG